MRCTNAVCLSSTCRLQPGFFSSQVSHRECRRTVCIFVSIAQYVDLSFLNDLISRIRRHSFSFRASMEQAMIFKQNGMRQLIQCSPTVRTRSSLTSSLDVKWILAGTLQPFCSTLLYFTLLYSTCFLTF